MSEFLTKTYEDLRCGRESWRVLAAMCAPALLASMASALLFG